VGLAGACAAESRVPTPAHRVFGKRRTAGRVQAPDGDQIRLILERPPGTDPTPPDCAAAAGAWYAERGAKWILMNIQQQKALTAARSGHPGGVLVLYRDGGVRFVPDSAGLPVWRAWATRAGESPGDP
jgi:hypothetical protein